MLDSIFPFGLEELHLMGHGHSTWPIKVKINMCIHAVWLSFLVSEMLRIKDGHCKVYTLTDLCLT
jgi:hypothetical protein